MSEEETGTGEEISVTVPESGYTAEKTSQNRVFYEIFVGSFSDSNGDGIGDLRGIINRMDYLNDGDPKSGKSLGVEGLWLTPIFKSSSYHKYNVDDYYTIDPTFGTMDDLKELIELCHERNVLLILDLVINHTGSGNEWFKSFSKAQRDLDDTDPYFDFYSYYRSSTGKAEAGRSYQQLPGTDLYYECNFSGQMPEGNFDNDFVRQTFLDVAKYYLDLGVDGFRFDAAKYIYYTDDKKSAEFWDWYLAELRALKPDIYTVAEVWDGDSVVEKYYGATNCFDFTMSQASGRVAQAAKGGDVNTYMRYVSTFLDEIGEKREDAAFVPFLTNHDMDRAAGFLTEASAQMHMAANLYLLLPGSPFIYYGEEIGMRGSRGGASTDANRRLAMLWGDDDTVSDPQGSTYAAKNQTDLTVQKQLPNESSLLNYYKKLLAIRRENPEIANGKFTALALSDTKLGGFVSEYEGRTAAVLHNTTGSGLSYDLSKDPALSGKEIAYVIGQNDASLDGTTLTVGAQTSVVLR